jgi:hypothetical protein
MTQRFIDVLRSISEALPQPYPRTPAARLLALSRLPYFGELTRAWGQFASATGCAPVDVFRDPDFAAFMARIEPVTLLYGGRHRGLYREAMKGLVPDSVRLRPDKARPQPLVSAAVVASDARPLLESLFSLDRLSALGLINPEPLAGPLARWLRVVLRGERDAADETDPWWEWVWPLLAVEAFLREIASSRRAAGLADYGDR